MRPQVWDRLLLPILIPLGILLLLAVVLYSMSRILLALSPGAAAATALGIALVVLLGGTFFATQPVSRGQVVTMVALPFFLIVAGGAWGQMEYNDKKAAEDHGPALVSGTVPVAMIDNAFRAREFAVAVGTEVTFELTNNGAAIHNMRIAGPDNQYDNADDIVSQPDTIRVNQTGTLLFRGPGAPGEMNFRCDFHPVDMTGTITIQ